MLFNSFEYLVFLPVVVAVHWALPTKLRNLFLLGASYVFYGAWDVRFLALLWLSTIVDYAVGRRLERTDSGVARRRLVMASLGTNLGILAVFKYFGFFVDSAVALIEAVGLNPSRPVLSVVLPVGISFYTFQTLSYSIDVYRRKMTAEHSFVRFALYVAFFPQLVAGPIERAHRLLPQLKNRVFDPRMVESGLLLLARGLFKKLVIGDTMAGIVDASYAEPVGLGTVGTLAIMYAFALQIYGDFSGYTDMARGSAMLVGVNLMENFRQPYLATSLTDFWRRWHISLSDWLRDYLYIPLGGNRSGLAKTYRNLILTMLLGGLWHGAAWTFVAWGGLHGVWLAAERWVRSKRKAVGGVPRLVLQVLTFHGVVVLWVFFRASDWGVAMGVLSELSRGLATSVSGSTMLIVALAMIASFWLDLQHRSLSVDPDRSSVATGLTIGGYVTATVALAGSAGVPFVYFQF